MFRLEDMQWLARNAKWQPDNQFNQFLLPSNLRDWLCNRGSLTSALKELSCDQFEVEVLQQTRAVPFWHEQKKLNKMSTRIATIRAVNLRIHNVPVVFARSIIPLTLTKSSRHGLGNLGSTPLGHLLFKDGRMRVSRREFACITAAASAGQPGHKVYARRTPYDYMGGTILVSEFFLPSLNQYL